MGNYLKMANQQQIQALASLGWSNRAISRELCVDRQTVAKYRSQAQNPPEAPADPESDCRQNPPEVPTEFGADRGQNQSVESSESQPRLPSSNSAQLRPHLTEVYQGYLKRLTAQRIYQDLVENHCYRGSYDSVKRYVRKLRKRHRRFRERLTHIPGREAQVDFGKSTCLVRVDGRYKKVWLFKMTLSCSKHAYEELVLQQDVETFLRCHERAFAFFGGVPEIVTLDNLKAAVIKACVYEPVLNETYFAFATHWGFAANPCMPRTPEHKGVVERDVGYTKHNALDNKRFESLDEGNAALVHWNRRWAGTRIHGTTKCQVYKLFCELERPVLRPCAERAFEYFTAGKRKVDVNGLIEVENRYYAVPPKLVGEQVVVHFNNKSVKVFHQGEFIIAHHRLIQKGKVSAPQSCNPDWKHPDRESQERYYCRKAREIGPGMHFLVHTTLVDPHPLSIRRVRGFMNLARKHGRQVAEQAAEMLRHNPNKSYDAMKCLCEQASSTASPETTITQEDESIRSPREYESYVEERTI